MSQGGRPFLDFYGEFSTIPTSQRIPDRTAFGQSREFLFRKLGIPLHLLEGKSIFELGPGNGQKAEHLLALKPERYVAVDGNLRSIQETTARLQRFETSVNIDVIHHDFLDFQPDDAFHLVIAEAVVPTQQEPLQFLRQLQRLVAPGGILVYTCMDSCSLVSEVLRRAIVQLITDTRSPNMSDVPRLVEFFKEDLRALPGMSRFPADWVVDQLVHPWIGPLLDMPQSLNAFGDRAYFLGSSPSFALDWRWYKAPEALRHTNEYVVEAFWQVAHNFLDHRVLLEQRPSSQNRLLYDLTNSIYGDVMAGEFTGKHAIQSLSSLKSLVPEHAELTRDSIVGLQNFINSGSVKDLDSMRPWWGRGQQYVSVVIP